MLQTIFDWRDVSGWASVVYPLWLAVMKKIVHKKKKFEYDHTLQELTIDPFTGKRPRRKRRDQAITILV